MSGKNPVTSIKVKALHKSYQIYEKPVYRLLQMFTRGRKKLYRDFWALRDVTFDVKRGETVGIIGRNGSGKSTLLQIICGTLRETGGNVEVTGRIAALLELGSGFNPEFSGRDNVYLNATLLGMSRAQIEQRFKDIEAFADIGDFIDQPVKKYSSGMAVRLAFAVAIHSEPEILIIDEALAVGDELFQRKCYSKIEEIKKNGATILFVSHSGPAVVELCDRAILIDAGELLSSGRPKDVLARYQKLLYAPKAKQTEIRQAIRAASAGDGEEDTDRTEQTGAPSTPMANPHYDPFLVSKSMQSYAPNGARIHNAYITNTEGERVNCLSIGQTYHYRYSVTFDQSARSVRFGMMIKTGKGVELGGGVTAATARESVPEVAGGSTVAIDFQFRCSLNPGVYFLNAGVLGITSGTETYLHRVLDIQAFRVKTEGPRKSTGTVDFVCSSHISVSQV